MGGAVHPGIVSTPSEFVSEPKQHEDRDPQIRSQETARREPTGIEDGKAIHEEEERKEKHANPRGVWLEYRSVGHRQTLFLSSLSKADVDYTADEPGSEAGRIGQVDEPIKDHPRRRTAVEVGQEREAAAGQDGINGQSIARASGEDPGGVTRQCQRVQGAARHVEVRVARRPRTGQNTYVDDRGQDEDAGIANRNHPWRGIGVASAGNKPFRVRVGDDSDAQGTQDVEDDQSDKVPTSRLRHVLARVSHFARGEDDQFRAKVEGEPREDPDVKEGGEASTGTVNDIRLDGARVVPIAETQSVMVGTSPEHQDEGQDQKTRDHDHLDSRKPELGLGVDSDGTQVEAHNDNQHYGDPDGDVDIVGPVANDNARRCDLVGHDDAKRVEVEPPKGKPQRG